MPETVEGVQVGEAPSGVDDDARVEPEGLPQESVAADRDGEGAAPASNAGKDSAVTGSPGQEEETEPPWVSF